MNAQGQNASPGHRSRRPFIYTGIVFLLIVFLVVPAITLLRTPTTSHAQSPDDWSSRSIYFIMTDRFSNGDTSNDNADGFNVNLSDPSGWHGGDFQGIINHLDYIKNMGFTAIWITPVVMQHAAQAYHGYWGYDFYSIDGHLGTMSKLQELVSDAHARNIWVMLDVVANHTGYYNYNTPTFPDYNEYHHNGNIADYNNQWDVENQDVAGLNDLNQDNATTRSTLLDQVHWLVSTTGVDGLRIDTVKHVPQSFWSDYTASAGTFTLGEVYDGDPAYVGPYTNYVNAVLDYPMYYTIHDVFANDKSMQELHDRYQSDYQYKNPLTNGVFIDNHDVDRFLCDASGDKTAQLKLALDFLFSGRGIPIMYYGTEQAFSGCSDPSNRENMFNSFDTNSALYNYVAKLNYIRNTNPALQNGSQAEKWVDANIYAFERAKNGNVALAAFNNCSCTRTVTIPNLDFSSGQAVSDALTGTGYQLQGNSLTLTLNSHQAVILTNGSGSSITPVPTTPAQSAVTSSPNPPVHGQQATISYAGSLASSASSITMHWGENSWQNITDTTMTKVNGTWQATITVPSDATQLDFAFKDQNSTWDNNNTNDYHLTVS